MSWEASLPTLRLVPNQIHAVCFRGGQTKPRALRLDAGDIPQCSEGPKCKTRVTDVVYNASNNELVCTNEELYHAY